MYIYIYIYIYTYVYDCWQPGFLPPLQPPSCGVMKIEEGSNDVEGKGITTPPPSVVMWSVENCGQRKSRVRACKKIQEIIMKFNEL